ncbi:MAG: cytochrome c biogenesis protein CcsA [Chitinophagaceae bacterium]|nr:cytochrome c biogenesis protein CcsA [Chitinophagaceae bacterium]
MEYYGENLLPGRLGHFFIVLSLVAAAFATFSYYKGTVTQNDADKLYWRKLARICFIADLVSIFAIFGILFFIIYNHLFEYKYAWQHSSLSLEFKYLLSCFWEGQEGSFLLWSAWHAILGTVLIFKAKEWESPVMTVISFAQFCLATMVAGIYVFGSKIGSNPFVLLRNEMDAPIFSRPDYLSFVTDGNDLNPLLQNYWMQIHPPVLFLGFASVLIPFAYAIAGLWTRKYADWTRPALPWALFSAAALGTGVMMGAMWAYESLTFGGYWAWDPVENASLVPWLILIAGIHTLLIFKHTGHSLRATCLFMILSFLFILYSTFLTRSGILGDASVHAFTDLGMNAQLLLFLLIFVVPSLLLFALRYKNIPHVIKEEQTSSREFWMFIGALVFFLSGISIIVMTSVPVFNKIASLFAGENTTLFTPLAIGEDSEFSYNRIQIFVAILIGILTAFTQYLKYKQTGKHFFFRKMFIPLVASLVIGGFILAFGNISYDQKGIGFLGAIWLGVVSSVFAIVANLSYIWLGLKGSLKISGGSIAHMGFGLMLLGILISSSKKEMLSKNTSGIFINFGEESSEKSGENLTLVKGVKTDMDKFWVTYQSDSAHPAKPLWYYNILFERKDGKETFTLQPNAFVNYKGNEGLMANPDAKHYFDRDVFTYITSLPDPERNKDTAQFENQVIEIGDTVFYSNGFFVLEDVTSKNNIPTPGFAPEDIASIARVKVFSKTNSTYISEPLLITTNSSQFPLPDTITAESLVLQLNKIDGNKVEIGVKESNSILEYVTLKAYKFPFINLLWGGTIIMVIGLIMSMVRRNKLNKTRILEI